MLIARAFAVPWGLFQVVTYNTLPYPPGVEPIGLGLVALIVVGNGALALALRHAKSLPATRLTAVASVTFDLVLIQGFVWLFAFDPITALWAITFIVPLEGAILFQLAGAMWTWAGVTVLYAAREMWGSSQYGYPLEWNSVSFRMGIAFIVALVAGLMARDLLLQRSRLYDALRDLQRVDKLRSALVSTLAHDVRNPLTTIRGVHQTLIKRGDSLDPSKASDLLEIADHQSERLERLATELLDLARLEEGRLELDVQPVRLREAVDNALTYLPEDTSIDVRVDEEIRVAADPRRLQQIFVNLASNALTYGAPPYAIEAAARDGKVSVRFRDTGPGISEEDRHALFEAFRVRGGRGSVGFGLAIVKALAEAQGGSVAYEPNSPRGACFVVTLPTGRGTGRPSE